VLPFLLYYFVLGMSTAFSVLPRLVRARQAMLLVMLLVVGLAGLHVVRDVQDVFDPPRQRVPDIAIGPAWIEQNTPEDALVLVHTPRVSYLYGKRTMLAFPDGRGEVFDAYAGLQATAQRERLLDVLTRFPVQYVLVEPTLGVHPPFRWSDYVRQVVVATLEADTARFRVVFTGSNGMVRVYQVVR